MSQTKVEAPFVENNRPFRNLVINGDMQIAQRATSFASVGNGDSQYTLDRWKFTEEGDLGAAEITVTQDTDVPTGEGFAKSLKCVCATADTSVASNTISYIEQRIEGQNLQHLSKGTSGAKKMTYSFFCKSNLTGTFTICFLDSDNTRQFSTSYSLSAADTWERIIINIPADTTGALDNDNNSSFTIQMNLQAGTDKSNGALTTAFEATAQGDRAVGQTNFFSSTDNNWYITGCQLEIGDAATDFEHLPNDVQLQRCQRYYQQMTGSYAQYGQISNGHYNGTSQFQGVYTYPVEMRASPSLSHTTTSSNNSSSAYAVATAGGIDYIDSLALYNSNNHSTLLYTNVGGSGTSGNGGNLYVQSTITELALVSEL
jgi:hypothetical protein